MSSASPDAAARRRVLDALQRLLAERQEHVLRLEALVKEEEATRKRLDELKREHETLTQQLTDLIGPPEGQATANSDAP